MGRDIRTIVKDPKALFSGLEELRNDYAEWNASDIPDNAGFWWKLVHLDPAVFRGAVTGVAFILASFGLVATDNQTAAIGTAVTAVAALVQAFWTRKSVTANAKVIVYKPDPVDSPTEVAPGPAVSSNAAAVVAAANVNPETGQAVYDISTMPKVASS